MGRKQQINEYMDILAEGNILMDLYLPQIKVKSF